MASAIWRWCGLGESRRGRKVRQGREMAPRPREYLIIWYEDAHYNTQGDSLAMKILHRLCLEDA